MIFEGKFCLEYGDHTTGLGFRECWQNRYTGVTCALRRVLEPHNRAEEAL
jgi:hypothetical protein